MTSSSFTGFRRIDMIHAKAMHMIEARRPWRNVTIVNMMADEGTVGKVGECRLMLVSHREFV